MKDRRESKSDNEKQRYNDMDFENISMSSPKHSPTKFGGHLSESSQEQMLEPNRDDQNGPNISIGHITDQNPFAKLKTPDAGG